MRAYLKPFDGFAEEDFETYQREKWSSNLFNLQRMQVKQKLAALGDQLIPFFAEQNVSLECETSSDRPSIWNQKQVRSQWLYFLRDDRSKKEILSILDRERTIAENIDDPAHHHRHIVLGVRVDASGVTVVCGVSGSAWLDRRNMQQKWAVPLERAKLLALLPRLDASLSWVWSDKSIPVSELDETSLDESLSNAPDVENWLGLERRFEPDSPEVQSPDFGADIEAVFSEMVAAYRFFAWSKENDYISIAQIINKEKKTKRQSGNLPFQENEEVVIVGGLFAGQRGFVQGFDGSGKVKVRVGTLTLPVNAGSLKRLSK